MLKIVCDGKLLEREFMAHDRCYRDYTSLPKDEAVRCVKFHIKNANTKYQVFVTKSALTFLSQLYGQVDMIERQENT